MQSFILSTISIVDMFKKSVVVSINNLRKSFANPTQQLEVLKLEQVTNIEEEIKNTQSQIQKKGFEQFVINSSIHCGFKDMCHQSKKDLFIQENKEMNLSQIELFGRPKYEKSKKSVRFELLNNKHQNETILLDNSTGKVINSWQIRPLQYNNNEYNTFYHNLYQMFYNLSNQDFIRIQYQFVGIQVQLSYIQDQWNISTKNTIRINESKIIGDTTVQQVLLQLLKNNNIELQELNINRNYIFHICSDQFTVLPTRNQVFIVDVTEEHSSQSNTVQTQDQGMIKVQQNVYDELWKKLKPLPFSDTQMLPNKQQFLRQIQMETINQGIPIHSMVVIPLNNYRKVINEVSKIQINTIIGDCVEFVRQQSKENKGDRNQQLKYLLHYSMYLRQTNNTNNNIEQILWSAIKNIQGIDVNEYANILNNEQCNYQQMQQMQQKYKNMDKQTLLNNQPKPKEMNLSGKTGLQVQTLYNYHSTNLMKYMKDDLDVKYTKDVVGNFVFDFVDQYVQQNNTNELIHSDLGSISYKIVGMLIDSKSTLEIKNRIQNYQVLLQNINAAIQLLLKDEHKQQCNKCSKRFADLKRHTKCNKKTQ